MKESCYLAVYGTLRKGGVYNHIVGQGKYICTTRIFGWHMYDNNGLYPYAVAADSNCSIVVELWEVSLEVLEKVDALEDYPGYYSRTELGIETGTGNKLKAFFYYLDSDKISDLPIVASGDWIEYINLK